MQKLSRDKGGYFTNYGRFSALLPHIRIVTLSNFEEESSLFYHHFAEVETELLHLAALGWKAFMEQIQHGLHGAVKDA